MYVTEMITEREKSKYLDNISVLPTFIFDKFVDDAQPEVAGEIVGRRHILRTLNMYLFFMNILYFRSQFKANPVNTKILQNPATGVRKVPSKPPTQVEEFNLEGQKRNQNKYIDKKVEKYEFHAQPVPIEILDGPVVNILIQCYASTFIVKLYKARTVCFCNNIQ